MRLISFALTTQQVRNRSKTVTRRIGWKDLKPGTLLMACEKVMGRQGKPLVRLAVIVVTSVERQQLGVMCHAEQYGNREAIKEGFPNMRGDQFVKMFCNSMGCEWSTEVTRIEFRYLPGGRVLNA